MGTTIFLIGLVLFLIGAAMVAYAELNDKDLSCLSIFLGAIGLFLMIVPFIMNP